MSVAEAPSPAVSSDADAAIVALSALSLSPAPLPLSSLPPSPASLFPVLAWDALNYLREFLDEKLMRQDPWVAVRALEDRVGEYAAAAARGGFRLVAVVDADTQSTEAAAKWRSRRARELKTEKRNIVLGADVLLTDALRERGVPVVRPLGADADDVLAALAASTPGGGVLSCDGDMFRYTNPPLTVYDGWRLVAGTGGGGPVLVPTLAAAARSRAAEVRSGRDVQPELAAAALLELADAGRAASAIRDKYAASAKGGAVRRGCSSSSDRRRGSLHRLAQPLRAAVYARLGEISDVHETMPVWEDGGVVWAEVSVAPDAALDALLDDVRAAAEWLDERDGDDATDGAMDDCGAALPPWPAPEVVWRAAERRFNRRILAAELCAAAAAPPGSSASAQNSAPSSSAAVHPGSPPGSLLALMRRFDEYHSAKAPSAKERSVSHTVTFESRQDNRSPPALTVTCRDCRAPFGIAEGEVNFFQSRGFDMPTRCKPCRDRRKGAPPGGRNGR